MCKTKPVSWYEIITTLSFFIYMSVHTFLYICKERSFPFPPLFSFLISLTPFDLQIEIKIYKEVTRVRISKDLYNMFKEHIENDLKRLN